MNRWKYPAHRSAALAWVVLALAATARVPAADPAALLAGARRGFAGEVQPILARHCLTCHDHSKRKQDLELTTFETLLRGSKSGAVLAPGDAAGSRIYQAIQPDSDPHMPPKGQLDPAEIAVLGRWIDSLPPAASELRAELIREGESPWAFRPIARPPVPAVRGADRVHNPIDAFILARLEKRGLGLNPPAARTDLIRRAYLDLLGLPPPPGEVDAFLADRDPLAFEKVIDRLLASPHYGERWARHWLDLARYAESNGFKSDEYRPAAWRYRDYVIRSLNDDKPFDRFVKEQIAGDELWPDDRDARLATAFNRHYPDESNARNFLQRRQEILNDITDSVGSAFLGITVGCARCHDHKYDPVPQADYYRLQAFFANIRADDDISLASPEAAAEHRRRLAAWEEKTAAVRKEMKAIEDAHYEEILMDQLVKYPPEVQAAVLRDPGERSPIEWQMFYRAKTYVFPDSDAIGNALKGDVKKRWAELKKELEQFAGLHPGELPTGMGIADAGRDAPRTHLLSGGLHDSPREEVEPGFLAAVDPRAPEIRPPEGMPSSGRRSALAGWLAGPANPLVPRVFVNRVWQHHFGRGIVATPNDFGKLGERPTHPELLDWLAAEFIDRGWSLKSLHRLIMTSSAYRQSTAHRADAAAADPDNRLWWRFERRRLEAEVIRDAALSTADLLNPKLHGPSVFPELPAELAPSPYGGWKASKDPAERNRRSIYVAVKRNALYPLFVALDLPDTHESCARRNITTTAPQALMLLNDRMVIDWARSFAARVIRSAGGGREAQARAAWRLAYARDPEAEEIELALRFLDSQRALIVERAAAGEKLALPEGLAEGSGPDDRAAAAALVDFCHVLLNSNEFVYSN